MIFVHMDGLDSDVTSVELDFKLIHRAKNLQNPILQNFNLYFESN